jgi:hypothetical protein
VCVFSPSLLKLIVLYTCVISLLLRSMVLLLSSLVFMLLGEKVWWIDSVAALFISTLIFQEGYHVCSSANSDDFSGSACDCSSHVDEEDHSQHHRDKKKQQGVGNSCLSLLSLKSVLSWMNMNEKLYAFVWTKLRTSSGALRLPPPRDGPIGGGKYTESGNYEDLFHHGRKKKQQDEDEEEEEEEEEEDVEMRRVSTEGIEIIDMDAIQLKYENKMKKIKEDMEKQQQSTSSALKKSCCDSSLTETSEENTTINSTTTVAAKAGGA